MTMRILKVLRSPAVKKKFSTESPPPKKITGKDNYRSLSHKYRCKTSQQNPAIYNKEYTP